MLQQVVLQHPGLNVWSNRYDLSGTITSNSYYDADLSGTSDTRETPKSTDEMKQISTYNNWPPMYGLLTQLQ